jgi:hypothetical protein
MNVKRYWHVNETDLIQELENFNYSNKNINISELLSTQVDSYYNDFSYILKNPSYEQIMNATDDDKEFLIYLNQIFRIYFCNDDEVIVEVVY